MLFWVGGYETKEKSEFIWSIMVYCQMNMILILFICLYTSCCLSFYVLIFFLNIQGQSNSVSFLLCCSSAILFSLNLRTTFPGTLLCITEISRMHKLFSECMQESQFSFFNVSYMISVIKYWYNHLCFYIPTYFDLSTLNINFRFITGRKASHLLQVHTY